MEPAAEVATAEEIFAQTKGDPCHGTCPWCDGAESNEVWPSASTTGFALRRCAACELAYTTPQLSDEEIGPYYSQAYYGAGSLRFNRLFESLVGLFRRRRAARLLHLHLRPGLVLDIGCGRGHFLQALRRQGWTCRGTELNETAAKHALETLGLDVTIGPFDGSKYPDASFDAIYLWHVLEHIPATARTLTEARRMLRPQGLLVIALPNLESWQARWSRYHWFHLDLPRHYVHCSSSWLTGKLRDMGFRIVEVNYFSAEQNIYGWIQSALNCAGLKRNLLYDILRRPSARGVDRPWVRYPVQSAVSLIGGILFLPLASVAMLVEALFRRGGTVEIYAEWPGSAVPAMIGLDNISEKAPCSISARTSHPATKVDASPLPQ